MIVRRSFTLTARMIATLAVSAAMALGAVAGPTGSDLAAWLREGGHGDADDIAEVVSHATGSDRFASLARWTMEDARLHPREGAARRRVAARALARLLETDVPTSGRAECFREYTESVSGRRFRHEWLSLAAPHVPETDLVRIIRAWASSGVLALARLAAEAVPVLWTVQGGRGSLDPVDVLAIAVGPPAGLSRSETAHLRRQAFRRLAELAPPDVLTRGRFDAFESLVAEHPREGDEKERRVRLRRTWDRLLDRSVYRPEDAARFAATIEGARTRQRERIEALCALAWIGTDEAIAAIDRFRASVRVRQLHLRPFRLDEAMDHPAPSVEGGPPRPLARTRDASGREWILLPSPILGRRRLSIARAADGDGTTWEAEIPTLLPRPLDARDFGLEVRESEVRVAWTRSGQEEVATFDLADLRRDADGDGLTDVLEGLLGLDPGKVDTDGDGEADGIDPWPLEPPVPPGAEREILEAGWSTMVGSSRGREIVVGATGQLEGYAGLALRESALVMALREPMGDALRVSCRIVERSGDRAVVGFSDDHMPSGHVRLRRIRERWLVTGTW